MGKVEDLRAIKDARFAAAQKTGLQQPGAAPTVTAASAGPPTRTVKAPPKATPTPPVAALVPDEQADALLCGHRAIGGKTCVRARGHDEASHKYAKS